MRSREEVSRHHGAVWTVDIVLVNQNCKKKTFSFYISSESTIVIKQRNEIVLNNYKYIVRILHDMEMYKYK